MDETIDEDVLPKEKLNGIGVAEVGAALQRFGWPDYIVFALMLLVCVGIGLYFALMRSSQSTQDYLVGGRSMKTFPIALSLIASFTSGISLLGIPTEIYVYGIQYMYIIGGVILMAIMFQTIYLPIFHKMDITSTYEYLERRFDKRIRLFGSVLFSIKMITWLPIVIYVPALAFNQVTGVNIHLITPVVCVMCIFYTAIGGLKAVVWTDVVQTVVMLGAMVLVAIKGTLNIGGIGVVLERSWQSDRIERPNFDINPLTRHSVWSLIFGGSLYWLLAGAVNQNMIQRYLSLPTFQSARRALWIFVLGIFVLICVCSYNGMLIYATYHDCDPLTTTLAKKKDQLLPLLVMEVLGDYPGLPGLFVAGVFSAALSSLSTALNSMAAVVLEDFYKTFFKKTLAERQSNILMKSTVVLLGGICVGLVFVVETLGQVLQLTMSIGPVATGPSLGLFTMGILLPWITAKGALIGGISGLVFMSWLCFKVQASLASGNLFFPEKPVNTDGCIYNFTPKQSIHILNRISSSSNITDGTHINNETFILYGISYLWYTLIGALVSTLVALLVSFITKPLNPKDVDPALLAPFVRRIIRSAHHRKQVKSEEIIYTHELEKNKNCNSQIENIEKTINGSTSVE